ncbi:transcriptional regulator CynR [Gordonia jinhuaensis]|uniref:Transcription regulator LysR family protein n=1 Tax=Gordonia jinhuaensis TaxID=1517702 RepID=A0A916WXY4_9ACTN|nr:LysR family transcriptional regulator [Gordonia jinhuaensis]GGB38590.1 transcription regulator LysR family protein [Gordonia jinhuaensis]
MDLHLVTYFVAVVDHGGITKAAQSLYISQPSLSQAIRTLERRLGATLFDRTGRRLELTDAGRAFDETARRILADVDRAKSRVQSVRELRAGRVDVVTYSAFSIDPLIELTRRFRLRHPHVVVRITAVDGPSAVLGALRRGAAELGLTDMSADHESFTALPLGEQELVLAIAPDLVDGVADPVARSVVQTLPLVADLADQSSAAELTDVIAPDGTNVAVDCAHSAATFEFVARGVGGALVPRAVADSQLPTARQLALDPPLRRQFGLVLRSGPPSPAALAFLEVAGAGRAHAGDEEIPVTYS